MPLNANQKTVIVANLKIILDNLLARLHDNVDVTKTLVLKTLRSSNKLAIRNFEDDLQNIPDSDQENPLAGAVEIYLDGIHDVTHGNIEGLGANVDDAALDEYARHVIAVYFTGARPDPNQSAFRRHGYQVVLGVEDGLKGAWNTVFHPINTGKNLVNATLNYKETASNIKKFAGQNRLRFFSGLLTGAALGQGAAYAIGRVAGAAIIATEVLTEFETLVNALLNAENVAGIASATAGRTLRAAEEYRAFFVRPPVHAAQP